MDSFWSGFIKRADVHHLIGAGAGAAIGGGIGALSSDHPVSGALAGAASGAALGAGAAHLGGKVGTTDVASKALSRVSKTSNKLNRKLKNAAGGVVK